MSHSSWKDQIKQKWGPHSHCSICGKAIPPDKKFCSQTCRDKYLKYEMKQKKQGKMQLIFLFVLMGFLMFMLFFMSGA
ncbi:MAG: DUF2116 family Zn-ribbon domain-containing protein [Promethearchaeota archaeon]